MHYYATRASDAAIRATASRNAAEALVNIQDGLLALGKSIAEGEPAKDQCSAIDRLVGAIKFQHALTASADAR